MKHSRVAKLLILWQLW